MRLANRPQEFIKAIAVIEKIEAAGYEAYFVGGSVRDALLGKKIHDVDIATSAYPNEIKAIFSSTIDVGIQHGTVLVLWQGEQYEITSFRTESTYQDYRRPDRVTFVRSLEEDLKRRDFTINALAMDKTGEIVDLFDGVADLEAKLIRAVGNASERFHEDALRMLRGLRFMSQLGFSIHQNTFDAIVKHHALLEKISVERVQVEFEKLMLGEKRSVALKAFVESECYLYCPGMRRYGGELLNLADFPDSPPLQNEIAVWTMVAYAMRLESSQNIAIFLKQWKCSNHLIKEVKICLPALKERLTAFWQTKQLYQLGEERVLLIEGMLPYFKKVSDIESAKLAYDSLPIHSMKDLAIDGNILLKTFQKKPGKWLGDAMDFIEEKVLIGELENQSSVILQAVEKRIE